MVPSPPKAILFDIGGVCVISPFRAILDYEIAHNIPEGYINFAIQKGPLATGAWQQIERGEVPLDDTWFARFKAQLENRSAWAEFRSKRNLEKDGEKEDDVNPPTIDAKSLFWDMMRISRTPDPYMYPALLRLAHFTQTVMPKVAHEQRGEGKEVPQFILGALSNTIAFPTAAVDNHGEAFTSSLLHRSPLSPTLFPPHLPNFDPANISTHFDIYLSSAHLGVRKPDPAAYRLAVRELSRLSEARGTGVVEPGDVVFLDDIGANLKGAKGVGLRTIKVPLGGTKGAVKELEEMIGKKLLVSGGDEEQKERKTKSSKL
ncbi:unnamed protein product [Periconia digitata]|uniref:HAD-like protein n=1 Tax=Periconia digitata TaxID=1303443 RepID=A0A9W4XP98_9PLEO|nr:unnamed protein product [Periconia digitata]